MARTAAVAATAGNKANRNLSERAVVAFVCFSIYQDVDTQKSV